MPVNIRTLLVSPVLFGSVFAVEVSPIRRLYQQDVRNGSVESNEPFALSSFSSVFNAQILPVCFRNKYGSVLAGDLVAGPSFVHLAFATEGLP